MRMVAASCRRARHIVSACQDQASSCLLRHTPKRLQHFSLLGNRFECMIAIRVQATHVRLDLILGCIITSRRETLKYVSSVELSMWHFVAHAIISD